MGVRDGKRYGKVIIKHENTGGVEGVSIYIYIYIHIYLNRKGKASWGIYVLLALHLKELSSRNKISLSLCIYICHFDRRTHLLHHSYPSPSPSPAVLYQLPSPYHPIILSRP